MFQFIGQIIRFAFFLSLSGQLVESTLELRKASGLKLRTGLISLKKLNQALIGDHYAEEFKNAIDIFPIMERERRKREAAGK